MKQTLICIILLILQFNTFCQNADPITKQFYPLGIEKKLKKIDYEKITYSDSMLSSVHYGFSINLLTKDIGFDKTGYFNGHLISINNNVGSLQFWVKDYGPKYDFSREMVDQVMKTPEVFLEEMRNDVKKDRLVISITSDSIKAITVGGLPGFQYVCDKVSKNLYNEPMSTRTIKTEVFYKNYHFYTFCTFNIEDPTYVKEWQALHDLWLSQIRFNE
jgi:hypothetical protein